jgi:hypothetical protein
MEFLLGIQLKSSSLDSKLDTTFGYSNVILKLGNLKMRELKKFSNLTAD